MILSQNKNLVESFFGHGGRRGFVTSLHRKLRRKVRPLLGKSGIPFDWVTGFHVKQKIGNISIKNQGQSSSCGGQAKSYWLGIINALLTGIPYVEVSAKSIYSRIFYPGGGTTVYNLEKDLGALDESILSSNPETEANLEDKTWLNASNLKLAMAKAGWTTVSVSIDIESIAEAIRDYGAIIWEITGQNNGTWFGNNPLLPLKSNPSPHWNHFMCSEGAGMWNNQQVIDMFQSWGEGIGDAGIQHFTQRYIDSGYVLDCFTFVKKKPNFIFSQDLSYGMQNNDVLQLQKRLNVYQSGWFGPLTYAAVIFYQKWHWLPETGFVGPLTRASLNSTV